MPPVKQKDGLKAELDKLALSIASTMNEPGTPLQDRLDAFKVLTAYHLGLTKLGKKSGEDSNGETFDAFRKSVEASGG